MHNSRATVLISRRAAPLAASSPLNIATTGPARAAVGLKISSAKDETQKGLGAAHRGSRETPPFRPDRERGRRRRGWLLAHASESEVRLQFVADQAGSKHIGDSRNRGKGGQPVWRSRRPIVEGMEIRNFGDEQGRALIASPVPVSPRREPAEGSGMARQQQPDQDCRHGANRNH